MKTRLLVAACFLSLLGAGSLRADTWYEHYLRANEALEDQLWEVAIEELNDAIALRGDSIVRARIYGMKVISYFPYFKLGIGYYHLGRLEAALQAFDTEERLGEIKLAAGELADLEHYRELTLTAKQEDEDEARNRILEVVRESIEISDRLERRGSLEKAIEALSQGLAAANENPDVQGALARLQSKLAERQRQEEAAERAARLVVDGTELLMAAEFEQAASRFKQALALREDPAAESLLRQAETGLRNTLAQEQALAQLKLEVQDELRAARRFVAAGDRMSALAKLQRALVLDDGHREALDLQSVLIREQGEHEATLVLALWTQERLVEADRALDAGNLGRVVALANEVLARDREQIAAKEMVREAYLQINRDLLGEERVDNLPPAISFIDLRAEVGEGMLVETVTESEYVLSGLVFDESPVEIVFFQDDGNALSAITRDEKRGQQHLTHFRLALRLEAGPNQLRMVAEDSERLSSSSTYDVLYEPPFFRQPVFFLALLATVLGPGFAVFFRRNARRRRLQRRRFNPYVAGAPVFDESQFFGRSEVIDRVLEAVASNSIMLFGERRIGKTSIQHHLRRRLLAIHDEEYDFYPVFIDLQGIGQDKFFATIADEIFHELGPILEGFEGREPLEQEGYDYRSLVGDLRGVLRALHERSSKKRVRLVLQIDEIDQLNSYEPQVNQLLRSLFMKSLAEDLVAVVSGVQIKKHWELEGSPWYNFFEEIEILPLGREGARQLCEQPIRGVLELEPGLFDRIYDLSRGRPYALQKLCKGLVNRAHEEGRRRITLADLQALDPPSVS